MSQLNYYRIGRTTLWLGSPLRIAVRTDRPSEPLQSEAGSGHPLVSLSILPSETRDRVRDQPRFEFDLASGLLDGLHHLEVSTSNFPVGHYEVQIKIGSEEGFHVPEILWVLERKAYREMVLLENRAPFLPSLPLKDEYAVNNFVETLVRQMQSAGMFDRDGSVCYRSNFEIGRSKRIASGPIRWTTQGVLNEVRDLSVFGLRSFLWEWWIVGGTFRMTVTCDLRSPLSEASAKSLGDKECGGLFLLNIGEDLPGFKVTLLDVTEGSQKVKFSVEHQIDVFPISD